MATEVEKLALLCKGYDYEIGGITLGERESTPDEIAREIRKLLIAFRRDQLSPGMVDESRFCDIDLSI